MEKMKAQAINLRSMRTLVLTAFMLLALRGVPAQETSAEWWTLTLDLQSQASHIGNEPDRRFIRSMINKLAAKDDAMPTQGEQFWLLSIKAELAKRKCRDLAPSYDGSGSSRSSTPAPCR